MTKKRERPSEAQIEAMIPVQITGVNRRIARALIEDRWERPAFTADMFPAMNFGLDPEQRLVRIGTCFALDVAVGITVIRICDLKKMVAEILKLEAEQEARADPAGTAALGGGRPGLGITVQ